MNNLPDVIVAYLAAYNRMDVAALLDCLSEDVTFQNFVDGQVTVDSTGKQAFSELATAGVQAFEKRQQRATNVITVAGTTLIEVEFSALVAADLPNGWKAGQTLKFQGASAFRVEDRKIVSITDQS